MELVGERCILIHAWEQCMFDGSEAGCEVTTHMAKLA